MTRSRASRRLAARLHRRNEGKHRRADAAANAADRAAGYVWQQLLGLLKAKPPWLFAEQAARRIFGELSQQLYWSIRMSLWDAMHWSWRGAVRDIGAAVPKKLLARAYDVPVIVQEDGSGAEAEPTLNDYLDILFPPPPEADIKRIIFGNQWQERLAACTRLADPATLANIVAGGIAAGKSNQEIAKDVLPAVNNVRASARRIARTESVRVAGAMQLKAHEALGDLVIGYQVHSMHDIHTRPWHRARDGTIYHKQPEPGQKGLRQMPHPPDEPEDPAERPPGTPQTAWNCRCYLIPVLRS